MQTIEQDSIAAKYGFRGHEFIVDKLQGGGLRVKVRGGERDGETYHLAGNPEHLSATSATFKAHNTAHTDERLGRMAERPSANINAQNLAGLYATGLRADNALEVGEGNHLAVARVG